MIKLANKKQLYLISSGFILAASLLFVVVIFPLVEKIKNDNLALVKQKMVSENFYQNWRELAALKKSSLKAQERLSAQTSFLTKNDALEFIMATENIAQNSGVRQEISVIDKIPADDQSLNLKISLFGSFPDLVRFLIQMENAPYFNNVSSIQISRMVAIEKSDYQTGDINSVISLSAPYQP